ncbi:MAG: homocysteine S-methyltransferase family protein [Planctomycetota bacterium]
MAKGLLEAMRERILLADGAMGTQQQYAGLEPGGCGEAWNLEHPDRLLKIHGAYVEAGSDCLITNTFGGSRIMLARHEHADKVREINVAGAKLARQAFGDKEGFVIGDIGPFGGLMEPYGEFSEEQVTAAFEEQASALVEGGVDAILIETQTSLEELGIGIRAAKKAGAPCIIGSIAYDVLHDGSDVKTMMGIGPEDAVEFMKDHGVDVLALNCGAGVNVNWATKVVERYRRDSGLPTMAQPNAGLPVLENQKVVYKQTPEEMVAELPDLLSAGANIIGGCCGSTPDHIRLFRKLIDQQQESSGS